MANKRLITLGVPLLLLSSTAIALQQPRWLNLNVASLNSTLAIDGSQPYSYNEREFTFSRLMYNGGSWGYKFWGTDFPQAERHLMTAMKRLTNIRTAATEHPIRIADPEIFRYPFVYAVEVGQMKLSSEEATILRKYLTRGGFLVVDDFWGSREWVHFESQIGKVFPDRPIFEIPMDHELFHCFYDIEEIVQVPAYGRHFGATYEEDGYVARCLGIADDNGRLMVVINWNTDLGDAWEWVDRHQYPAQFSTPALKLGINMVVYAMSH